MAAEKLEEALTSITFRRGLWLGRPERRVPIHRNPTAPTAPTE
jgi:hypothetical protein